MILAWRMVRHRFAGFAGTFVALTLGVAIVAGATTVWLSSQPEVPARYAASPVLVHSPEVGRTNAGHPEYRSWRATDADGLAAELAGLPGVRAAVVDRSFYVQRVAQGQPVGDPDAALRAGRPWAAAALGGYRLTAGAAPTNPGEVALDLPVGTSVPVVTAAGPDTWRVTGTVAGPGLYVSDDTARRFAAGARVIGLTVAPDADPDAVAAAAGRVTGDRGTVVTGDGRAVLEDESVGRIRWLGAQLLIAMVVLSGFVAVFVVASTCALSAAQRRREIGLLRALGATPRQVRRLMYAEATVIAAAAGTAGAALGAVTAPALAGPLVAAGLEPPGFTVDRQPVALAAAAGLGLAVALAGVWSSARRSSRVTPLEALRVAAVEQRPMTVARWLAGAVTLTGGGALLAGLPWFPLMHRTSVALAAAMLLLVGVAALAPALIGPLVRAVTWPWRRSATGLLVRESTLAGVRRVASTAAPVVLAVGFAGLMFGTVATVAEAAGVDAAADIPAVTVAVPHGAPGLAEAAVAGQPGRSHLASRVLLERADGTTGGYPAAGVSDAPGLVLDDAAATELGVAAGATVAVTFADGSTVPVRVAAVTDRAPAPVVLPRALIRDHDAGALTPAVLLDGPARPAVGVRTLTAREWVQIDIDHEDRLITVFLVILVGLGVGYTGLAVGTTLLMATAARRSEFAALRLAGADTAALLRLVCGEAMLAVAVGSVLGGAVAWAALAGMVRAVSEELGQPVDLVVPWGPAAWVVSACAAVAVLATAGPALRRR